MRLIKLVSFLLLASAIFTGGCYYDNEEELYGDACDTEGVTYSGDVLPILESNCYSCHIDAASFGGVSLEGHANVVRYVESGALMGSIRWERGFDPMPDNAPQLSECNISIIQAWVDQGAPNN